MNHMLLGLVTVGLAGGGGWLLAAAPQPPPPPVRVGVLSGHDPSKFRNRTCTAGDSRSQAQCNLAVFDAALAVAAQHGVDMVVLPEAYALGALGPKTAFEPVAGDGTVACGRPSRPVQSALSCMSANYGVAVAANLFGCRSSAADCPKAERRLTEVVFSKTGELVVSYDKHHLFPNELLEVTAGPFGPTAFSLLGRRWGILICFEGVWPIIGVGGNWSQSDDLVLRQNVTELVWSIGGVIPAGLSGEVYVHRYPQLGSVLAAEDRTGGAISCAPRSCRPAAQRDLPVLAPEYLGYEPELAVRVNTLL